MTRHPPIWFYGISLRLHSAVRGRSRYHLHTERMIAFILERLDEDEVLAGGMPNERLNRLAVNGRRVRSGIGDYQQAASMAFDPGNWLATAWWWIAKYHALALRQWIGVYHGRAGYDPTWRRRYRPSTS